MEQELMQRLKSCNVDVNTALDRFMGNEALYIKFLHKFLADTNYRQLLEAVEKGNAQEAFMCAHTLKGVAANLSLLGLLKSLTPLVECFRGGSVVEEETGVLIADLMKEYVKICDMIQSL